MRNSFIGLNKYIELIIYIWRKVYQMIRPKPGDRIGVIHSYNHNTVRLVGYGTYVGDLKPMNVFGLNSQEPVPKIVLDDGQVVFGNEVYWGHEDYIKEFVSTFPFVEDVFQNGTKKK
jgi:hypothetical protein